MNEKQKNALIAVAVIIASMLLYPPFHRISSSGRSVGLGYHWLFEVGREATVDIATLLVQWVGVLIVGGIVFFILKDDEE